MKQGLFVFISLCFFSQQAMANLYLYSDAEIPVRAGSKSNSKVIDTLLPGESFEVLKWNNFHSRIRLLPSGQEGFIEKSLLLPMIKKIDPEAATDENDNREFLSKPLKLTITNDEIVLMRRGAFASSSGTTQGNAEFTEELDKQNPTMHPDVNEDLPDQDSGEFDPTELPNGFYHRENFKELTEERRELLSQFGLHTWKNAIEKRKMAPHTKKKGYRSGNQSKGWCSRAVRETLTDSGLCGDYSNDPDIGDAVNMHSKGVLNKWCPKLQLSKDATKSNPLTIDDINNAPGGSVIVYSGYAGRKKHNHGHIEIKIPVTAELKKKMGKDGIAYEVGDYMYCSDYCKATPTKKSTNNIEAIYTLK